MMSPGADTVPAVVRAGGGVTVGRIRLAWRAGVFLTVVTGMMHLLNLVGWTRLEAGPFLVTPFRLFFSISWMLLAVLLVAGRRLPRPAPADLLVAFLAVVIVVRGMLEPATIGIAINWLTTAAGVYFLVRLGIRDRGDARVVIYAVVTAVLAICFFGIIEYLIRSNPLFDAIEVEAIGIDRRIAASDQFYRVRSFVGHPGFAAAIIIAGIPLLIQVFWRRRGLMAAMLLAAAAALFMTFSRGSWLLGAVVLVPLLLARSRRWLGRNIRWVAPLATVLVLLIALDYWSGESAVVRFEKPIVQEGMIWSKGDDGPVVPVAGGVSPGGRFVYFDIDDGFAGGEPGPVTVVLYYRDYGLGAVRVEYYSVDRGKADAATGLTSTARVNKTGSGEESSAAFLLDDPVFDGRLNRGADFRIVDDDNLITLERVELKKGKLKLVEVIKHQWLSRSASISTRAGLFPFAWDVFRDNPWGVGLFNSPGTGHHAVDSWPLTWLMEFGWLSLPLLLLLAVVMAREAVRAATGPRCPATVLLLSLLLLMLHGGHLMIIYDKPSIVMLGALAGVYVAVRPWRRNGPDVELNTDDLVL